MAAIKKPTRIALLEAAEELWGIHGFDGVSLHRIINAATSANAGAIQYYFRNKDGLIKAVLQWRSEQTERARGTWLAKLVASDSLTTAHLLEALLRPVAEIRGSSGKHSYAAFLCAFINAGRMMDTRYDLIPTAPLYQEIVNLIINRLPLDSEHHGRRRLTQVCHLYWQGLVLYDRGVAGREFNTVEAYRDDLLRVATAALLAD